MLADGAWLANELADIDPETFTEPITLTKYWDWHPGKPVLRLNYED